MVDHTEGIALILEPYGWDSTLDPSSVHPVLQPARVLSQERDLSRVISNHGELLADLAGRLRYMASSRLDLPAVGDWVLVEPRPNEGRATIHQVLERRTALVRKDAGDLSNAQVLAANVDLVIVVTALNAELSLRRLERYLSLAAGSGAACRVVLNKCDLFPDRIEPARAELAAVAPGVPVEAVSALEGAGIERLRAECLGKTSVLVGSSGVGKSTLTNALLGEEQQETGAIRESDDRGRHTTTRRDLFRIPGGGCLIDTPGLREVGLWEGGQGGLARAFRDIEGLARQCRFGDCGHAGEPGCAIEDALATGALDPDRFESYRKLLREQAWIDRKADKRAQANAKRRWKTISKRNRKRTKLKERRGW